MPYSVYPALVDHAEADAFLVTFTDIPEAVTGGRTLAEALQEASDALAVAIEGYMQDGAEVPEASEVNGELFPIALAPHVAARVLLHNELARLNISGRALAERMGKDEKNIRRILLGKAKLDQTLAALRFLGIRPALSLPEGPAVA